MPRSPAPLQHSTMTYPRAHLVDQQNGGYYHCISRCVRQSWLCGIDHQSGKSYEHRRIWIAKRIQLLTSLFAVDVYAYAIMSNHYHLVIRLDPRRTKDWTDTDIVDRWLARDGVKRSRKDLSIRRKSLLEHPEKIEQVRNRLGSLSWFMRHINEPIARIANGEDECTGRFWEGRFKSVALLDRTALLACMVYVDLNPVRANAAVKVPSPYTSAQQRVRKKQKSLATLDAIGTTLQEYLGLLRWTRKQKQGARESSIATKSVMLRSIQQNSMSWQHWIDSYSHWHRAYGSKKSLDEYAKKLGQNWLQAPKLRTIQGDSPLDKATEALMHKIKHSPSERSSKRISFRQ